MRLQRTDAGSTTVLTALTGPDGWYHFEEVASGVYDVIETQPAGFANASSSRTSRSSAMQACRIGIPIRPATICAWEWQPLPAAFARAYHGASADSFRPFVV